MFTRTSTLLVAVAAALMQPLAGVCLCGSCGPTARAAEAPAPPTGCCSSRGCQRDDDLAGGAQGGRLSSCCGSAGACHCGSSGSAGGDSGCSCGAFEHQPAVAAHAFDADHPGGHHGAIPVAAISHESGPSQNAISAFGGAHGQPVRFSGLRLHAVYCVWII